MTTKPGLYRIWLRPGRKAQAQMDPNEVLKQTSMREFLSKEAAEGFLASEEVNELRASGIQAARDYPHESMLWVDL